MKSIYANCHIRDNADAIRYPSGFALMRVLKPSPGMSSYKVSDMSGYKIVLVFFSDSGRINDVL